MATYGYARVSTTDQHADRQLTALLASGVERKSIFIDRKSGKDFSRPAWKRLRRRLRKGDLLVVQTIDRLGRSYGEISGREAAHLCGMSHSTFREWMGKFRAELNGK